MNLAELSIEELQAADAELTARLERLRFHEFFPDTGEHRRELYPKHLAFFAAGAVHRERLFMAGNRVGKSEAGAYETTCHLTGLYPHWWEGKRFADPVEGWAIGSTLETMRDIVMAKLTGPIDKIGTGMIPGDLILDWKQRQNSNGALDYVTVRHVPTGGISRCGFKSYDQGRKNFEGTAKHFIWPDEEPPQAIYTECLTRTATTKGVIYVTFTPLNGATQVVTEFMEKAVLRV